jgi:manganese transport protein
MQGFVGFTIPLWLRRLITMLPTFVIVALGIDPTQTLVISQVVLSLVLPMPIIALIYFTRRRDIMGVLVNKRIVTVTATVCAVVILSLNLLLLYLSFGGSLPY